MKFQFGMFFVVNTCQLFFHPKHQGSFNYTPWEEETTQMYRQFTGFSDNNALCGLVILTTPEKGPSPPLNLRASKGFPQFVYCACSGSPALYSYGGAFRGGDGFDYDRALSERHFCVWCEKKYRKTMCLN